MLLREFLYVDTEKVRGLLAQLAEGIPEEAQSANKRSKTSRVGPRGLAQAGVTWGTEEQVTKSLGDALFPTLEEALEVEGLLTDLSEELQESASWLTLPEAFPPGSIIRVTAPAAIFDARYLATTFAGLAATAQGFATLGVAPLNTANSGAPRSPKKTVRQPGKQQSKNAAPTSPQIEDAIPQFPEIGGMNPEALRAFVQIARGLFKPGLHMLFRPTDGDNNVVSVRLQEGRTHLDTDPEVLFARFGLAPQDWTVVGSVGHYPTNAPAAPDYDAMVNGKSVSRMGMTRAMNSFLEYFGQIGFTDAPKHPGFALVPFAVYRTVGTFEGAPRVDADVNEELEP